MSDQKPQPHILDRIFELRTIIAILFGVYGVFCIIWGFAFTTPTEIQHAAGINMNLLMGFVMLATSVGFSLWVVAKPIEQEEPGEETPAAAESDRG